MEERSEVAIHEDCFSASVGLLYFTCDGLTSNTLQLIVFPSFVKSVSCAKPALDIIKERNKSPILYFVINCALNKGMY